MNATDIEQKIAGYIRENAGLDQHRNYLGISKIGGCPRRAWREYFTGIDLSEEAYRMCFAGYEQERSILVMLAELGIAKLIPEEEKEVVAPFDHRLLGHIDGLTTEGDLLEVKSVSTHKFRQIAQTRKSLRRHFIQVQLYMLYGDWNRAFIVYRCRETYDYCVLMVPFLSLQAGKFQQKAKSILAAIDSGIEPECECGRCGDMPKDEFGRRNDESNHH